VDVGAAVSEPELLFRRSSRGGRRFDATLPSLLPASACACISRMTPSWRSPSHIRGQHIIVNIYVLALALIDVPSVIIKTISTVIDPRVLMLAFRLTNRYGFARLGSHTTAHEYIRSDPV
jgi:hypothetical protein